MGGGDGDYSTASRGTLKLKGVAGGRVDKAKRKKRRPKTDDGGEGSGADDAEAGTGRGGAMEADQRPALADSTGAGKDEMAPAVAGSSSRRDGNGDGEVPADDAAAEEAEGATAEVLSKDVGKTEAQLRHGAHRRKMLDERLKREGVKTHKERVEELNRYLSGLSEHHDMPRIGPG